MNRNFFSETPTYTSYASYLRYTSFMSELDDIIEQAQEDVDMSYFAGTDEEIGFYTSFRDDLKRARKRLQHFVNRLSTLEDVILLNPGKRTDWEKITSNDENKAMNVPF